MTKYYYIMREEGGVLGRDKSLLEKECQKSVMLKLPYPISEEDEAYRIASQLESLFMKERYAPSIDVCINGQYKTVDIEHVKG